MQFNLWMMPELGNLLLENAAFYIRPASGCGGDDDYPLEEENYYEIDPTVYEYLGPDPTVQKLLDLANLALGSASLPGPNAPQLYNIKYALRWINEGFENCGFIYFVPPLTSKIELTKVGTYIDNEPLGAYNAGDQILYQFTVENTGNLTFSSVHLNDPMIEVIGGPITNMAPGAVDNTTFSGIYTITEDDIEAGSVTNVAMAIGLAGVNAYYASASDVQVFDNSGNKTTIVLPSGNETTEKTAAIELNVTPNPFQTHTEVTFSVNETCKVQAQIYDMNGRLVKTLFEGEMEAGDVRTERYFVSRSESFATLICVIRTPKATRAQRIIRAH